MEIIFHSHANKIHFHKQGCAPSLILKVRIFGTRKWPIPQAPFVTAYISPLIIYVICCFSFCLACVASVSVWFRSKEIPRKGTFGFDRARNETRAKK